jgi:hypothetical protein
VLDAETVVHATVQFERGDAENPCGLVPDEVYSLPQGTRHRAVCVA